MCRDVLSDFNEDILNAGVPRPTGENGEFGRVNFTVQLIDEREVHARKELDVRSNIRVRWSARNLKTVDAVLMNCLGDCMAISSDFFLKWQRSKGLTCPGPMIVPFQLLIMISSPSSRP
jgi:hypothetical protein